MEFHMINITYAALHMRAQTEKTTFSCKDDQCKTLHLYWSGAKDLFIDEAHTALGIFPVCFPCMPPTPLCDIFSYYMYVHQYRMILSYLVFVIIHICTPGQRNTQVISVCYYTCVQQVDIIFTYLVLIQGSRHGNNSSPTGNLEYRGNSYCKVRSIVFVLDYKRNVKEF